MQVFSFISVWKIEAPLQAVWEALYRIEAWPSWWHGVEEVEVLNWGAPDRVGFRSRQVWKSKLPYKLKFEGELTRVVPLERIEISSQGELQGSGLMRFASDGRLTTFQYDWNVETTKAWMNLFAPILKPAFSWNHDIIMNWGAQGLARKLGTANAETSDKGAF
ncbi:MAG TPA: SRPBCC family protein [Acidobacteriaceae bacterium]|jgi:hypothetical protein|nr:SRPBCC family protein [Acidobacteriaceae bacterium]